jgi:molybdopterin-guanine dinucleotide biosynthesis protein A
MGRDKAFIEWEGRPLWQVQLAKLRELGPERLVVSCREKQRLENSRFEIRDSKVEAKNSNFEFRISNLQWLYDPPGSDDGPLGAITRCLERVQMPLLVLAVDMPWMSVAFLRERILPGGFFRGAHGFEALCAVYEPGMLPVMQEALRERRLALQRVIGACQPRVHELAEEDAGFFRNANTPEEL